MGIELTARKIAGHRQRRSTALRRTISRRSRRFWVQSLSITRRFTGSSTFLNRSISSSLSISRSTTSPVPSFAPASLLSPVTLKTFLAADLDIAGLTLSQYLARLAAEATTIINAVDYGRTVYDLAIRRELIQIGEDMVNVAFDAPVDFAPRDQIEDAERRLYDLAETGRYGGGFQKFETALTTAIDMAARAYQREGNLSGSPPGSPISTPKWAVCNHRT